MGGCYADGSDAQREATRRVDCGPWEGLPDTMQPEPETNRAEAAARVLRHKDALIKANPCAEALIDEALRCALTRMLTGEAVQPPPGSDVALRYVKDRVNVPRDMSVWAARRLREALEQTAAAAGPAAGPPIPTKHRRDQDPARFRSGAPTGGGPRPVGLSFWGPLSCSSG